MKTYLIFFDNDGVTATCSTWRNDTFLNDKMKEIRDLDIYKWNRLDKIMRHLSDECKVYAICTSSWKSAFYKKVNINKLTKYANLQKIEIVPFEVGKRFSRREPGERIEVIHKALELYKPDDYIIIDDEFYPAFIDEGFHNVIKTDTYDGLLYQNYLYIDKIVDTWECSEKYRKEKKDYEETLDLLLSVAI